MAGTERWTPVQERVMDLVYGSGAGDWWHAPCGHAGPQMTVSPEGIVTCHHELSNRHDHNHWTPEMWLTWQNIPGGHCRPPACEIVNCGRTYTEDEVRLSV
jgi:hypothetical protein